VLVTRRTKLRAREDARRATLLACPRDLPLFRYFLDALPDAEPWPFAGVEYLGGIGNIRSGCWTAARGRPCSRCTSCAPT
jgi:hypothetical protein